MKLKLGALAVLVAVGAGALAVTFGWIGASAASGPQYLTAEATVGDVTDEVAATGSLAPSESYGLLFGADAYLMGLSEQAPASEGTWPVTHVEVEVGDEVAAGDVLATADTADLERQLAAATADLRSANINLAIAEENLDDAEEADDVDRERQAKLGLYGAQNQVSTAHAARGTIQRAIKAATLKAPIAGVVTDVAIRAGFDAPTGPAITIASTTYTVTTDVVEADLADIELGQDATVTIDALDATVAGKVTAISPVAGESTSGVVAYPVTVTLTKAPPEARSGMSADVTVTTASATAVLTVPSSALLGTEGAYAVMTLGTDGTPVRTPVEVGLVTSTAAEITGGLTEGTAVVTGTTAELAGTVTQGGGPSDGGGFAIPGGGIRREIVEDRKP
jgi:RND family efflux transporter MFP subunit